MANSTDVAYQRDMFLLNFAGGCNAKISDNLSDYDNAISEYKALLDDAVFRNDKSEISQLRREIQQAKAEKRIAKRMIENKSRMEIAYT